MARAAKKAPARRRAGANARRRKPVDKELRKSQRETIIREWRNGRSVAEIAPLAKCDEKRCENVIANAINQTLGLLEHNRVRVFVSQQSLRVIQAVGKKADAGDGEACRVLLAATEPLRKITGLDAASKHLLAQKRLEDMTETELAQFLGESFDGDGGD